MAVRTRGIYTNSPDSLKACRPVLSACATSRSRARPATRAPKAYVDALAGAAALVGTPTTQAATTTAPLINLEQRGAGDLLNLRLNSTTFPRL